MRRFATATIGVVWMASVVGAQGVGVKRVLADDMTLIPITTKLRFVTVLILPEHEEILEVQCGDKDFWVISSALNIATVKPAKELASTNLNIVTTSGAIYSFLLSEGGGKPDLKVYVGSTKPAPVKQVYFSARDMEAREAELTSARAAMAGVVERSGQAVATAKLQAAHAKRTYRVKLHTVPFAVTDMWGDDTHTFIRSGAPELPTVYERLDGEAALLNFTVKDGTYEIPKVVRKGYLQLGKQRLEFEETTGGTK